MTKSGRPRKAGERYPSGDIKPKAEPIAPAQWARIKNDAVKLTGDQRLGSELGRLSFHGELTNAQAAAGFRVAEIYHRYHRYKRLRETPKSPNYEQGFGGSADLAEERMSSEQLEAYEASILAAEADFLRLQEEMPLYVRELPQALVDLCVFNVPLNPAFLPDLRIHLDRLAVQFGEQWRRQGRRPTGVRPLTRRPTALREAKPELRPERNDAALKAVESVVRKLRADLDESAIATVKDTFIALVARERFNRRQVTKRSS